MLLVQLGACLAARHFGPLAISDDDYARVVIAQEFAAQPRLDPSGTSWLPFPFYVTGVGLLLFGSSLDVARALQLLLALASATVPEYPTAACLGFAMLCLTRADQGRWSLLGAGACFVACASRYEAWPIAGVYAGVMLCRALRVRPGARRSTLGVALLAAAFPVLWLLHGAFWHADPLFFVARVTGYKAALGSAAPDVGAAWLGYPQAALRQEPGLPLLLGAAVVVALLSREGRTALRSVWPVFLALGVLLVVLVLGDVRGGAPTHHPERALLSLWLVVPTVSVHLLARSSPRLRPTRQLALTLAILLVATVRTSAPRPPSGAFAERAEEEQLGRSLRRLSARDSDQIVVLTPDYGYLAVQAAAGFPSRFVVVDRNDPRETRSQLSARDRARATLAQTRAAWAVLPLGVVIPGYRLIEHGSRLALLKADGEARYASPANLDGHCVSPDQPRARVGHYGALPAPPVPPSPPRPSSRQSPPSGSRTRPSGHG